MSIKAMAWAWQTKLKGNRKLILIALADHADDEGKCWPGLKGIANKCGISRSSVIEHVNALTANNFINRKKRHDGNGHRKSNLYILNIDQSPETQRRDSGRQSPDSGQSKVQNLDGNNINHQIEPSEETSDKNIKKIFYYWKKTLHRHDAKLDHKRKDRIKKAFKLGYSMCELQQAINGCTKSSFHMGENKYKQRFDDINLILRDAEHIERFRAQDKGIFSRYAEILKKVDEGDALMGVCVQ